MTRQWSAVHVEKMVRRVGGGAAGAMRSWGAAEVWKHKASFVRRPRFVNRYAPSCDAKYDAVMRTTIDLPDDLHRAASQIARDRHQTLSRTVESMMRASLAHDDRTTIEIDPESGLPTVRVGRRITAEDVSAIEEDG